MDFTLIDWTDPGGAWQGEFRGAPSRSDVSVIFNQMEGPGEGPALHRHAYSETFVVRRGAVEFTVGEDRVVARAGQIVVVPAGVPHAFVGAGDGPIEMFDIHASPEIVTEWLAEEQHAKPQRNRP